jgi:hypothetical protein
VKSEIDLDDSPFENVDLSGERIDGLELEDDIDPSSDPNVVIIDSFLIFESSSKSTVTFTSYYPLITRRTLFPRVPQFKKTKFFLLTLFFIISLFPNPRNPANATPHQHHPRKSPDQTTKKRKNRPKAWDS